MIQKFNQKNVADDEKLDIFEGLAAILSQVQDQNGSASSSPFNGEEPRSVVVLLLNYITEPSFLLRKWYNQKPRSSNPAPEFPRIPENLEQEGGQAED